MSDYPQSSVTNKFGQVHGIDNLYIADGSLHVTNGAFNPVLTIMALGYWVSEHILREHGPPVQREIEKRFVGFVREMPVTSQAAVRIAACRPPLVRGDGVQA